MRRRPSDHDARIGELLRVHRVAAGLTQDSVGRAIGVTPQQVQKYEAGFNGIRAGLLVSVAEVLGVPARSFLPEVSETGDDLREDGGPAHSRALPGARELLSAFARIEDAGTRRTLIELAALLARQGVE